MGQSTDAIIAFGVDLGEDHDWEEFEECDTDEETAEAAKNNPLGWMAYSGEPHNGLVLIRHCSESCPMYMLAIEGTEQRAWRGSPKTFEPVDLLIRSDWANSIKDFCKQHGLEPENDPSWLLVSDWS